MLSEFEQRELRGIEQMLLSDSHFSARFTRWRPWRRRSGPRLARVLVVCGAAIMVAGLLLGLGDAFMQGLAMGLTGWLWTRSRTGFVVRPLKGRRTGHSA